MTDPFFLCYNGDIMKQVKKPILKKVRIRNGDGTIFYTYSSWETNEIDGVEYTPVSKFDPSKDNRLHQVHYLKKDSLEQVK